MMVNMVLFVESGSLDGLFLKKGGYFVVHSVRTGILIPAVSLEAPRTT